MPTFEDMRNRLQLVLAKKVTIGRENIAWAGIYSSVGRNFPPSISDISIALLMREGHVVSLSKLTKVSVLFNRELKALLIVGVRTDLTTACGLQVSCTRMSHSTIYPSWMRGHDCVDAVLSGRTIYVERLRQEGLGALSKAETKIRRWKVCVE